MTVDMKEKSQGYADLSEVSAATFGRFLEWAYKGYCSAPIPSEKEPAASVSSSETDTAKNNSSHTTTVYWSYGSRAFTGEYYNCDRCGSNLKLCINCSAVYFACYCYGQPRNNCGCGSYSFKTASMKSEATQTRESFVKITLVTSTKSSAPPYLSSPLEATNAKKRITQVRSCSIGLMKHQTLCTIGKKS